MRTVLCLLALLVAAAPLSAQRPALDILSYRFQLDLPDTGRFIRGVAEITVQRRSAGTDTLVLDLVSAMRVREVAGGEGGFLRRGDQIRVPLARTDVGRIEQLRVTWEGEPSDGLIVSRDSAGRWIAFGDNWPNRARQWLPTVDHPREKAQVTFDVTAPAGRTVVANGTLERTEMTASTAFRAGTAGRVRTVWFEAQPIPAYLMVIAAAPLVKHDLGQTACGFAEKGHCVPQQVYTAPEQAPAMPGAFAEADSIVRTFARLAGSFPYEKLAHLQSSTRYGGMENASAIFYSDRAFRGGGVGYSLIAHETAHQWFGDAVTAREWPHLWLSEGFATYFAALYTRASRGESSFRAEMARVRRTVLDAPVAAQRPVIDSIETDLLRLLNANSYQKGGFVLHMLRGELGDSAFFRGVRRYVASYRHGTALTDDLRDALERQSGRDLRAFFDQWLRRPGFASLTTSWRYDATTRRVTLDVEQGDRFAPYRFPLVVDVTDAGGTVRRVRVEIPAQKTTRVALPLELAAAPRGLAFDPDVELLAEIRGR